MGNAKRIDKRAKYAQSVQAGKELPHETKDLTSLAKWANEKYTDFEIARTDYGTYYLKWHGLERR